MSQSKFVTRAYYDEKGTNGIHWCGSTWNVFHGCTHVSEECDACWSADITLNHQKIANRQEGFLGHVLAELNDDGVAEFTGTVIPAPEHAWKEPLTIKQPALIFAPSVSDPFHESISLPIILHYLRIIYRAHWHTFQMLTKRPARMDYVMSRLYKEGGDIHLADEPVPGFERARIPNLWLGTTVGLQKWVKPRIPHLINTNATVRFLSMEPLLGPVDIRPYLDELDWVIVGGESGRNFRPMDLDWARDLRNQCEDAGVAFFFKQVAGVRPTKMPKLDGKQWPWLPRRPLAECPPESERRALVQWAEEQYADLIAPWADEMRATAPLVQLGKPKKL